MRQPRQTLITMVVILALAGMAGPWQAQAVAQCSPGQKQEADLAYASAYEFLKAQQWEQAIPRLESILEVCPTHVNSLRGLGTAYKGLGRLEEARDTFIELINVRSDEAEALDYGNLGGVYAKLKDYQNARSQYMHAQALAPDDCSILFNLGMLHMGVQDYRNAVETLEHTLEECLQVREQVLPNLAKACEKAAAKEKSIGNNDRAQLYREKHQQYAGIAGGSTSYDLVRKHMRDKNFTEAVKLLEQILAEDPSHSAAWLSLARCQDQLGKDSEAITAYERRLELRPDDENTTADLIILYAETGQCQKAISLAQAGKERFEPKGREHLAGIYFGWGMGLSCAKEYEAAKEKFRLSANSGVPKWSSPAQQQLQRQNELIEFDRLKKEKEAQGR